MGRYRVHHSDDEDDDEDDDDYDYDNEYKLAPMDWTIIPNDSDENNGELELQQTNWDVNAAYRAFVPSPPPPSIGDDEDGDDDDDNNDHYFVDNNLQRFKLMVQNDCLEQRYLELEHHGPKNKLLTRIRTVLFVVVAIVAIALKRYAPPPPQTSLLTVISPLAEVIVDSDSEDTYQHSFASYFPSQRGLTAQHETWGDYSRHLTSVLYRVMAYVLSVAWYAVSNSLRSAYEDLKVDSTALLSKYGLGDGDSTDDRKWRTALDKFVQSWSQIRVVSGVVRGDYSHGGTRNFQHHADGDVGWYAMYFSKYGWSDSAGACKWIVALEKFIQSSITRFINWWSQIQTTGIVHCDNSNNSLQDIQHEEDGAVRVSACPIRIPAASNRIAQLTRQADSTNNEYVAKITGRVVIDTVWSTEEHLRQTIGTSVSPQNLALKIISERMDIWGNDLVEAAPTELLRKMSSATASSNHVEKGFLIDKEVVSEWILPPAIGLFVVGSEGVGKRTIAHRLANFLLGHCLDVSKQEDVDGVLEVVFAGHDKKDPFHQEERAQSVKELIVNHVHRRAGLGSVVVLHHIESMPPSIVSDIVQVLSGKSHMLTYQSLLDNKLVEANCNGTVFVMTSKEWGANNIFRHIEQSGSLNVLRSRDALISSIREEVDTYLETFSVISSPTTVVPILPFQQDDLASILQDRVQALSVQYQDILWERIEISLAAIRFFVGVDHVKYSDLSTIDDYHFAYSTVGAHALGDNVLLQTLHDMAKPGARRHSDMILKIDKGSGGNEVTFRWCTTNDGLETCKTMM